jgi:hypothetical protein
VDSLRVFAAINGLPEVAATPAPTVAAPVAPVAKRLTKLPEITDAPVRAATPPDS